MPLFDLVCRECGCEVFDRYFPSFAASEGRNPCPRCRSALVKLPPLVVFHGFKPFSHTTKDGKTHSIKSESARREMMRRYGLGESPYSDTVEARSDPREFLLSAREEKKRFPAKYRKLREKVGVLTESQAKTLAERAGRTRFETARR